MEQTQRFREGQEVVVASAIREGTGGYGFYHGGTVRTVKLNRVGKINSIEGDLIHVSFPNGLSWALHPDELTAGRESPKINEEPSALENLIQLLPGITKLERHPLFEMAQEGLIAIVDNVAYGLSSEESGENFFVDKKPRGKNKRAIQEIGTLRSLDELAQSRVSERLEAFQNLYAEMIWNKTISGISTRIDTPILIASQVFPYLRDEGYQERVSSILGAQTEERSSRDSTWNPVLNSVQKKIAKERLDLTTQGLNEQTQSVFTKKLCDLLTGTKGETPQVDPESLMSQAIRGRDVVFIKGKQYELYRSDSQKEDAVVIGDKRFVLRNPRELIVVERDYAGLLARKTMIGAIDTTFTQEKVEERLESKFGKMSAFMGLNDYSENGEFGFTQNGSQYFVWLKVPQFAIKSQFDRKCYLFPESRLGIGVRVSGQEIYARNYPILISNNRHPLTMSNDNYADICFGNNRLVEDTSPKGVAAKLRQAREILMKGYQQGISLYPHRQLGTCEACGRGNHYENQIVSEEKLKEMGVPIFDAER